MRAGNLDRFVSVQRKTLTYSDSGEPIENWLDIVARTHAGIRPVPGDERFAGDQWVARQQVEFRLRWSEELADISPLDRIIYPAPPAGQSEGDAVGTNVYDIMDAAELGRREGWLIRAARRADV